MSPIFEESGYAEDGFLDKYNCIKRLIDDYHEHGSIIVAFDFDNTVCPDETNPTRSCNQVIELLQTCSRYNVFKMVCYTCRNDYDCHFIVRPFLEENDIRCDAFNENIGSLSMGSTNKVFYNVFLDDRAGLRAAYEDLVGFLEWYIEQGGES